MTGKPPIAAPGQWDGADDAGAASLPDEAGFTASLGQAAATMAEAMAAVRLDESELLVPEGFDLALRGTWRAAARTLVGHVIEPLRQEGGVWVRHFPALPDRPEPLDLPVLARAASRLLELLRDANPLLVIAPVHWATLDRISLFTKYVEICAKFPEPARRLLVLELAGVPEDMLPGRVDQKVQQLRPYCRAVICRARLERRDFKQLRDIPMHAVGIDMGAESLSEEALRATMGGFMAAVEPLHVRTHIQGLSGRIPLLAAAAAGFDYLAGQALPAIPGSGARGGA